MVFGIVCRTVDDSQEPDSMLQLGRAHALLGDWDAALALLEQVGQRSTLHRALS